MERKTIFMNRYIVVALSLGPVILGPLTPVFHFSAIQTVMAQNSLRFRHHRHPLPYPVPRRIQSLQYFPSCSPTCPASSFQRHLAVRAYDYIDLARRVPSRLPRPRSDTSPEFAHCEWRLPAIYDTQLPQRNVPESLHASDWLIP
jgi:hypothetical protein